MAPTQTQDAHKDPVAARKLILDQREANERMVAVADRLHGQRPHAIPGERHLDEDRATQEGGYREPTQRDDREHRIAQRMAEDDATRWDSLGACGAGPQVRKRFDECRALVP